MKTLRILSVAAMTTALTACGGPQETVEVASTTCEKTPVMRMMAKSGGEMVISKVNGALIFGGGLKVMADGAPKAFHPENTGLASLRDVNWTKDAQAKCKADQKKTLPVGLVTTDDPCKPVVQPVGEGKGYFVSYTALQDNTHLKTNPLRYQDATKVPYIALNAEVLEKTGVKMGDLATVINVEKGIVAHAIVATKAPHKTLGHGSMALAKNVGIRHDAKSGGTKGGLVYVVYPGSGNGQAMDQAGIDDAAAKLFEAFGGIEQGKLCK